MGYLRNGRSTPLPLHAGGVRLDSLGNPLCWVVPVGGWHMGCYAPVWRGPATGGMLPSPPWAGPAETEIGALGQAPPRLRAPGRAPLGR